MSIMVCLDTQDPTPPYEQIRRQISALIESGTLTAGARLPTVRQLAADLRVAPGTVARSFKELEAVGMVTTRRGAGTTVAPGRNLSAEHRTQRLRVLAEHMVATARNLGIDDADITAAIAAALG